MDKALFKRGRLWTIDNSGRLWTRAIEFWVDLLAEKRWKEWKGVRGFLGEFLIMKGEKLKGGNNGDEGGKATQQI